MKFELPKLNYDYSALEPHFDTQTMELHHTKHHQSYIDKLNAALENHPDLQEMPVENLLMHLNDLNVDEPTKTAIRNHGGGHANHTLFWQVISPEKELDQTLIKEIEGEFGSIDEFKNQFTEAATKLFGSGWVWLAKDEENKLHMHSLPNQDSPYLHGHTPIFGLDVWEHAYYLKYQNRRAEYIDSWWNTLKLI
jgi:Fe-Mn family superoxide dismutase